MSAAGSGNTNASAHQKPPQVAEQGDKEKLRSMVKEIGNFCMLCTTDMEGKLHSRPMAVNGELDIGADGTASINFFTYGSSHKVLEMKKHGHQINLSFSNPSKQSYVSMSGDGELSRDKAEMEKRWNPMLNAWFPKGLEEPDVALLRVTITKAEYWDAPSSIVAHAISFVKAQITGTPADPADHKALTLEGSQKETKAK